MPELTRYDLILMVITGGLFVVGLWCTIVAFLYGFLKRLDRIVLLLEEANHNTSTTSRDDSATD